MKDPTKCIGSYAGSYEMYRILCRIQRNVQDLKQDPTKCIGCYVGSYEMYRILCRILGIVKDLMQDPRKSKGSYVGSYQMYRILCRIFNRKCVGSYAGSYQFCSIFYFQMLGSKFEGSNVSIFLVPTSGLILKGYNLRCPICFFAFI